MIFIQLVMCYLPLAIAQGQKTHNSLEKNHKPSQIMRDPLYTLYVLYFFLFIIYQYRLAYRRLTGLPVNTSACQSVNRLPVNLLTHGPVYPITCQFINLSSYKLINFSTCVICYVYIVNLSTCQSVNPSTLGPVDLSTCKPVDLSTLFSQVVNKDPIYLFFNLYLSKHKKYCLSYHN